MINATKSPTKEARVRIYTGTAKHKGSDGGEIKLNPIPVPIVKP
jgi:hypothetical protein